MGVETPIEGIWSLNVDWPLTGESRRQGDDHLRLLKDAILKTFAAINEPITVTDEELNILAGAIISTTELNALDGIDNSQTIQTQIDDPNIARLSVSNIFIKNQVIKDPSTSSHLILQPGNSSFDISNHGLSIRRSNGTNCAYISAVPNSNQFNVFLYNSIGTVPTSILRGTYGAKQLNLTATDLTWGGAPIALKSEVTDLHNLTALKTDFINTDILLGFGTTTAAWNTNFGTENFVWGFSAIGRTDGLSFTGLIARGRTGDNHTQMEIGSGAVAPGSPAKPVAGIINLTFNMTHSAGYRVRLWARKLI